MRFKHASQQRYYYNSLGRKTASLKYSEVPQFTKHALRLFCLYYNLTGYFVTSGGLLFKF